MNIDEMKKSAINMVNVNDSIKAPLLKLNVKVNSTTTIPTENELIVYVDKSSTPTDERKTYVFTLSEPLAVNNEFIIEPEITEDKILLKAYVTRGTTKEEVASEGIMLFEGVNYISTNYTNADIGIVYPKNTDLVNFFLNNSIYGINNKNKVLTLDDIYFKDCFTEVDGEINASFKALTVGCISSKSGNFRLDSSGNLQVKSIIVDDKLEEENTIDFDQIYPVGSIYMSVINTNPGTYFGGTWERFANGRCLIGVDESQIEFNIPNKTGGHKELQSHSHTGSTSEAGWHTHGIPWWISAVNSNQYCVEGWRTKQVQGSFDTYGAGSHTHSFTTNSAGAGNAGNLQPYITCYMWRRIA